MMALTPEQIAELYRKKQKPPLSKQGVRNKTRKLIDQGVIERKDRCERCGRLDEWFTPPIQVHHRNYDDPMDIEWLCWICHAKEHRKPKRIHQLTADEWVEAHRNIQQNTTGERNQSE